MRSSSKYLAVSRREGPDGNCLSDVSQSDETDQGNHEARVVSGLRIHLEVSYKTLFLVFTLFTILQRVLEAFVDQHGHFHF